MVSLEKFLLPTVTKKSKNERLEDFRSKFSRGYLRNNAALVSFLVAFSAVNIALFTQRAVQYADGPILYMFARAGGNAESLSHCTDPAIPVSIHQVKC